MNFASWTKIFCTLSTNELFDAECLRSPFALFFLHAVFGVRCAGGVFISFLLCVVRLASVEILVCRQRVHGALRAAPASEAGRFSLSGVSHLKIRNAQLYFGPESAIPVYFAVTLTKIDKRKFIWTKNASSVDLCSS